MAEKYLRPRILGNSLAGWVGADLFGALDLAIGQHKRLKVGYSYEGREAIVERRENELLVIPEDPYLKKQGGTVLFSPLPTDALRLSSDLLEFLKLIGPPPAPKYTRNHIFEMSSEETRRLIEAKDGDFSEACAYHEGDQRIFDISQIASTEAW